MTQTLEAAVAAFSPALPLGVALSAGADSTALLVACARKWPGQVVALHVNHGLQSAAAAFEQQCQRLCASHQVPLLIARVDAKHALGESPEDAARTARYQALEHLVLVEYAHLAIQSIAIAQHADDQVETILLALSRGAGLPGLSSMPASWVRSGLVWYRPLLQVRGADVRQWLQAQATDWVEDPSNADLRFTRNQIRHRILPVLHETFPHFHDSFARTAVHAAQAQRLLDVLAQQDLEPVAAERGAQLRLSGLRSLSPDRQANVLRYWLKHQYSTMPSTAQLQELLRQIAACSTRGHRVHIKVGMGFVERRGALLAWYNP